MLQSTRSTFTATDTRAVLMGIAPDGGLFVDPSMLTIPEASRKSFVSACMGLKYPELSAKVMSALLPGFSAAGEMETITSVYKKKFTSKAVTPLVKVDEDYALELYHGPTLAFKDVALSVLPLFITSAKRKEGIGETISILTATSGDTGKAALEGFHDVEGTDITVFFPYGGVSEMQRLQMVTQEGSNVRVCAVRGNFDDCQTGVKTTFAKKDAAPKKCLSSANSINIGRLVPQVVYYFSAYSQLIERKRIKFGDEVDFVVPTGNFGDILAGYIAKLMGLPVHRLVCASNSNNVLTDFITTGVYDRRRPFLKTVSPSMDILVSSNLERLLYYVSSGDCGYVAGLMGELKEQGFYRVEGTPFARIGSLFSAGFCTEEETAAAIAYSWSENGYLMDTHTAVGFGVLEKYKAGPDYEGHPCVVLSTASPFKFPGAVLRSIDMELAEACDVDGDTPGDFLLAERLSKLTGVTMPKNLAALKRKPILHTDVIDVADIVKYSLCL